MDTDRRDEGALGIADDLRAAFAAAARAREELDAAEDNVRALVAGALAEGCTWAELEQISGLGDITLQHRYRPDSAPEIPVTAADTSALLL